MHDSWPIGLTGATGFNTIRKLQREPCQCGRCIRPLNNEAPQVLVDPVPGALHADQGEVTYTRLFCPEPTNMNQELYSKGRTAKIRAMEAYRLQSIWLKREQELGYFRDSAKGKR